jgi:hypothetical protein
MEKVHVGPGAPNGLSSMARRLRWDKTTIETKACVAGCDQSRLMSRRSKNTHASEPSREQIPMLKFTRSNSHPIWVDPDKVVAVRSGRDTHNLGFGGDDGAPGARIYLDVESSRSVQESVEDVVAKIEQAKER